MMSVNLHVRQGMKITFTELEDAKLNTIEFRNAEDGSNACVMTTHEQLEQLFKALESHLYAERTHEELENEIARLQNQIDDLEDEVEYAKGVRLYG